MARTTGSEGGRTEAATRVAAASLIARSGFEAVTMRELAAKVGVQPAALYRYFPTKQDLLFQLMLRHMEELLASWQAFDRPDAAPADRLSRYVEHHIRFHLERRETTHVSNLELRSLSASQLPRITALRGEYEEALRAILREGAAQHVFARQDAGLTAMALIQMITGVIVWYRPEERLSVNELLEAYRDMALRLVGADSAHTSSNRE